MSAESVQKRDGRIQAFDKTKIAGAIIKAFAALGMPAPDMADDLADQVASRVGEAFEGATPRVEDVQDVVERVLMERGFAEVAKAYILYRRERSEVRALKEFIGVEDDLKLTVNAAGILKRRYLLKNDRGEIIETPAQMMTRVAQAVARPDAIHDHSADISKVADAFCAAMSSL